MLKQFISLFCEKFLQNKSEYISNQAFPSHRINLSLDTAEFIPPCDGYVGFYKPSRNEGDGIKIGVDVYAHGTDTNIVSRATQTNNFASVIISSTIPVKKGYSVNISSNNLLSELWFSPSVGSKQ